MKPDVPAPTIEEAVESLCKKEYFSNAKHEQSARMLAHLLALTLREAHDRAEEIGLSFGTTSDGARGLILHLRRHLKEYYESETGKSEKWRVEVHSWPYHLSLEAVKAPGSLTVDPRQFARMVEAFCRLRKIDRAERSRRFREWRDSDEDTELHGVAREFDVRGKDDDFDRFLKERSARSARILFNGLQGLAERFGIHSLLLEPLLSKIRPGPFLTFDFAQDFESFEWSGKKPGGRNAEYRITSERLEGTDAVFVSLILRPDGESHEHEHPGDELIFVRDGGPVEVVFEQSGLSCTLGKNEMIHFYAENRHKVRTRRGASLFIIRFYQIEGKETRQAMWVALEQKKTKRPQHTDAWIRQLVPNCYSAPPGKVADALGLARFLQRSGKRQAVAGSLAEAACRSLERGEEAVAQKVDLEAISRTYGLERFLLENFLQPAVPGAAVLRQEDFREIQPGWLPDGVQYWIPVRNLSCGDISIAKVILQPNAATKDNLHAGFEAILVVRGSIRQIFSDGKEVDISATESQLCHFDSSGSHYVRNVGSEPAEFLVIRFYRDGEPDGGMLKPSG